MYSDVSGLIALKWKKAQRSLSNGECVEVAWAGAWIAVRDSKNPNGKILSFPEEAWRSFLIQTRESSIEH
jgi:Domain of unknown function (DUF397)